MNFLLAAVRAAGRGTRLELDEVQGEVLVEFDQVVGLLVVVEDVFQQVRPVLVRLHSCPA